MKNIALTILATLALSTSAIACEGQGKACPMDSKSCPMPGQHAEKRHHDAGQWDTNNDGKVSFKEFKAAKTNNLNEKFKKMDVNGDGFISKEDRIARHQKHMEEMFNAADANKDGALSKEEFAASKGSKAGHHGKDGKACNFKH